MRRYRDVLVQPGCGLDKALEAGDHTLASFIYEACEEQYQRTHYGADTDESESPNPRGRVGSGN